MRRGLLFTVFINPWSGLVQSPWRYCRLHAIYEPTLYMNQPFTNPFSMWGRWKKLSSTSRPLGVRRFSNGTRMLLVIEVLPHGISITCVSWNSSSRQPERQLPARGLGRRSRRSVASNRLKNERGRNFAKHSTRLALPRPRRPVCSASSSVHPPMRHR